MCHHKLGRSTTKYFLLITRGELGEPLQSQLPLHTLESVKMKKYFAVPRKDAGKWKKVWKKSSSLPVGIVYLWYFCKRSLPFHSLGYQVTSIVDRAATTHKKDLKYNKRVSSGNWSHKTLSLLPGVGVIDSGSCSHKKAVK